MDVGKGKLILELYRSDLVSVNIVKRFERATGFVARSYRFTISPLTRLDR